MLTRGPGQPGAAPAAATGCRWAPTRTASAVTLSPYRPPDAVRRQLGRRQVHAWPPRFIEALTEQGYQCCIIDPEGDFQELPNDRDPGRRPARPRGARGAGAAGPGPARTCRSRWWACPWPTGRPTSRRCCPGCSSCAPAPGGRTGSCVDETHHVAPGQPRTPARSACPSEPHGLLYHHRAPRTREPGAACARWTRWSASASWPRRCSPRWPGSQRLKPLASRDKPPPERAGPGLVPRRARAAVPVHRRQPQGRAPAPRAQIRHRRAGPGPQLLLPGAGGEAEPAGPQPGAVRADGRRRGRRHLDAPPARRATTRAGSGTTSRTPTWPATPRRSRREQSLSPQESRQRIRAAIESRYTARRIRGSGGCAPAAPIP